MSMHDRAAQFSPFAALTGYDRSINEAARYVEGKDELDEDTLNELDSKINYIIENSDKRFWVRIRCFRKDIHKNGGIYEERTGIVRRIDEYGGKMFFTDGTETDISDIIKIVLIDNDDKKFDKI